MINIRNTDQKFAYDKQSGIVYNNTEGYENTGPTNCGCTKFSDGIILEDIDTGVKVGFGSEVKTIDKMSNIEAYNQFKELREFYSYMNNIIGYLGVPLDVPLIKMSPIAGGYFSAVLLVSSNSVNILIEGAQKTQDSIVNSNSSSVYVYTHTINHPMGTIVQSRVYTGTGQFITQWTR